MPVPKHRRTYDIHEGILEALSAATESNVRLCVEYMDTKRRPGADYLDRLEDLLRVKHRNASVDLDICSDDDAFRFPKSRQEAVSGDCPVVFWGVNDLTKADSAGFPNATGVNEEADVVGSVRSRLRIPPDAHRIVFFNDTTLSGSRVQAAIEESPSRFRDQVEFQHLGSLPVPDIRKRLASLTADEAVPYTFFFRDGAGRFFE